MTPDLIASAIDADIPILLWGPPGVGKTARIQALARAAGAHLETLVGSTLDPTDVSGLPVPDGHGGVDLAPPAWARRLRTALDQEQPAWLFLDELTTAAPSVRAALLRVVHERRLPALDLTGCRIVAAANGTAHAADGGDLDAATANRFAHISYTADADVHLPGLLVGWGRDVADCASARAAIVGFLRARPQALLAPPTGNVEGATASAWPSPRSWDALARIARTADKLVAFAMALVGPATAAELAAYLAALDLPDPEALLAGRAKLPARGDRTLAAWEGAVALVLARRDPALDTSLWRLCDSQTRRDLRVQLARSAIAAGDAAERSWDPALTSGAVSLAQELAQD